MDKMQQRLARYSSALTYEDLSPEAVHATKVRVIDTLGCLIGGFSAEPSRMARSVALEHSGVTAATVIGTAKKSSVEMAAFANAATCRYLDYNDVYTGEAWCHPSDNIPAVLAMAEATHASGQKLITGVALAYEVYMRIADKVRPAGWDYLTWGALTNAIGVGKVLDLTEHQMAQCMSLAVVPNNALGQNRRGELSMWKAVGAGQAGKAGVFAAQIAKAGMEGPNLPFEGEAGFLKIVLGRTFSLDTLGGNGTPFKIISSNIKPYAACGVNLSSAAAALGACKSLKSVDDVQQVTVHVTAALSEPNTPERAPEKWRPQTRETADHSIPYTVGAALADGAVGAAQFAPERYHDPKLLSLVQKVRVVHEPRFADAQSARVEVVVKGGQKHVAEVTSVKGHATNPMSDEEIGKKFLGETERLLGKARAHAVLDTLWRLEEQPDVAPIPQALVLK